MPQDFSHANLQGRSFKGQNLTGANFHHADIRGADFTNATLVRANFSHARAGLHLCWMILSITISFLLLGGLGFWLGQFLYLAPPIELDPELLKAYVAVPGVIVFIILAASFISSQQRFSAALVIAVMAVVGVAVMAGAVVAAGAMAGAIAVGVAWTLAGGLASSLIFPRGRFGWPWLGLFSCVVGPLVTAFVLALAELWDWAEVWIFAELCVISGVLTFGLTVDGALTLRLAVDRVLTFGWIWILAGIWTFGWAVVSSILKVEEVGALEWAVVVAVTVATLGAIPVIGVYISRQDLARDPRFAPLPLWAATCAAKGYTSFQGANLTDASFTGATLKNTDFRRAILTSTRFENCHQLDYALLDNTPSVLAQLRDTPAISGTILQLLYLWVWSILQVITGFRSEAWQPLPRPTERIASLGSSTFFKRVLAGHSESVNSVAISPDGRTLASGSVDNTAKLWDLRTGRQLHTFSLGGKCYRGAFSSDVGCYIPNNSVAISSDGQTLTNFIPYTTLKLWNLRTGQIIHTHTGLLDKSGSKVISSNGQLLAIGKDKTIKLWNLRTGQLLRTLSIPTEVENLEALSLNGQTLANVRDVGSGKRNEPISIVEVWNLRTGQLVHTLPARYSRSHVIISADGQTLVTVRSTEDNPLELFNQGRFTTSTVEVWRLRTRKLIHTLPGDDLIDSVAISSDGQTLAVGGSHNRAEVWNLHTGQRLCVLSTGRNFSSVESIAISPNGQIIATGSRDKTVKIWQLPRH